MRIPARFAVLALAGTCFSLAACTSTFTISTDKSESFALISGEQVPVPDIKMGDAKSINAILDEGINNSQVMGTLTEMCETFGPRLTGSSNLEKSQRWARELLESYGADNAHLHKWGTIETRFDRGPSTGRVVMATGRRKNSKTKELRSLEFSTLSWSVGTDGPVSGKVVHLPTTMEEYEAIKGQFADAWVLITPKYSAKGGIRSTGFQMKERMDQRQELRKGIAERQAAAEQPAELIEGNVWEGTFDYHGSFVPAVLTLDESTDTPTGNMSIRNFSEGPITDISRDGNTVHFIWTHDMGTSNIELTFDGNDATGISHSAGGNEFPLQFSKATAESVAAEHELEDSKEAVLAAVLAENPNGFVSSSKDERVWTTSSNNWMKRKLADYPTDIEVNVRESDFDYLSARANEGVDIQLEFDLAHNLAAGPFPAYNVIAEIVGSEKPDEVVIISAHMDSWDGPGSQGTIDNGTGTSVTIEAARILLAAGVKPKRTIRFALWSGEEQGLLGSRGYVDGLSEDELAKISATFVDDGGTNTEGGIPAAEFMVEYLAAATAPINGKIYSETDGKFLNVNVRPTGDKIDTHGGSDHASFNAVGVPGFFWDEIGRSNYQHGWHTQNDRLDLAIEEYLIQSATNAAIVAYNLANAPDLLPREDPNAPTEEPVEEPAEEEASEEGTSY